MWKIVTNSLLAWATYTVTGQAWGCIVRCLSKQKNKQNKGAGGEKEGEKEGENLTHKDLPQAINVVSDFCPQISAEWGKAFYQGWKKSAQTFINTSCYVMAPYVLASRRTCGVGIHRVSEAACLLIILSAPLYILECKRLPSSFGATNPSDCARATKRRELIMFKRCYHFYQHLAFLKSPKCTPDPLISRQRGSVKVFVFEKVWGVS